MEHKHRKKEHRIWKLRGWLQGKHINISETTSMKDPLLSQLLTYPNSERDDLLDSLAYHLDIRRIPPKNHPLRLPSGKILKEYDEEKSFEEEFDKYLASLKKQKGADDAYF